MCSPVLSITELGGTLSARQHDDNFEAGSILAIFSADGSAVKIDDAFADGEPEPVSGWSNWTSGESFEPDETVENARKMCVRNAGPFVDNCELPSSFDRT